MDILKKVLPVNLALAKTLFRPRQHRNVHKGHFGHGLLLAGSPDKMGAALLCTGAALRSGPGLLSVLVPPEKRDCLFIAHPAAMCPSWPLEEAALKSYTAIGMGPGTGTGPEMIEQVEFLLKSALPQVLDADALNIISARKQIHTLGPQHLLTPHPKEFDRLFGPHKTPEEQLQSASRWTADTGGTLLLKGAFTYILGPDVQYMCRTGHQGLAKGGSGDVLTGIILGLLAQQYSSLEAALLGAWIHGMAAQAVLEQESYESMLPSDLPGQLGRIFKMLYGVPPVPDFS